ncbi:Xaa-Pro aminopeptidase [Bacteroidales bacterium]|nr:Xaa-Pro aminopeptidase [Bacteroidales bacterium]
MTINSKITERIDALRKAMESKGIDAYIVPSSDPHISEYPADYWKTRSWISGFTGSAGTIAVTKNKAGLWTDSRYFLQAIEELEGSGIELFKEGVSKTPSLEQWLTDELPQESTIGIDAQVFSCTEADKLSAFFIKRNLRVENNCPLFDQVWTDRPPLPESKIFALSDSTTGACAKDKIEKVRNAMRHEGTDTTLIAALDTIAWLYNIRGNDVAFNPVTVAYALVNETQSILFINKKKLTEETSNYLSSQDILVLDYHKVEEYLQNNLAEKKVLIAPAKINLSLRNKLPKSCQVTEVATHPADLLKSIKNETEIKGFRNAMKKDGVALVRFLMWLENSLEKNEAVSEIDISHKLKELRSKQADFFGESFGSIVGYGPHGAIVHYSANEKSNAKIEKQGLLLIDSGGQYYDGTTDITRTLVLGKIDDQMKIDYSLVLKGHIALAMAQFPQGTKGVQLDILARQFMWINGINYLHGTGHGVGHFLNVHEGPQSIRMDLNPIALEPGMVNSNEPALYRDNKYGIRIENLIVVRHASSGDYGNFYRFETLTLCPIDTKAIHKALLTEDEIDWLNNYHKTVYATLAPLLTEEENKWLKNKTNEF